ncbi:MAG: sulfotransferase [Propionicimonas sp.]|uniref:sulfotransferase n=1 Tax=Propionicimonas sp. TaxID=1955623 RepID=UPI003D0F8F28
MGTGGEVLLYIGGYGRSGSTLLECLLARLDGVVVLGELEHLWERGVRQNQRCACGEPFADCPFWAEVGRTAFGGWDQVDVERVLALKAAVVRQRHLPRMLRRSLPPELANQAAEFTGYHHRICDAAQQLTGARVVVDSSKFPPLAVALAHDPAIDLRMIHLVRDSRGVAYSWSKTVARPETEDGEAMPRYSSVHSSAHWLSHNLAMQLAGRLGRPVLRIRYEDLVADPEATVSQAWRRLGLPGPGTLPMEDAHTIELLPTHSVAGNPMRFTRGRTVLRSDEAWRQGMPRGRRLLVTLLSAPLLLAYGYRLRSAQEGS